MKRSEFLEYFSDVISDADEGYYTNSVNPFRLLELMENEGVILAWENEDE